MQHGAARALERNAVSVPQAIRIRFLPSLEPETIIIELAQRVSGRKNRKDLSPLARCALYT